MTTRTAVPPAAQERPSEPQLRFLRGLWAERRVDKLLKEQFDWLEAQFNKAEDEQFLGCSVKKASDIITRLKALPIRDNIVRLQNADLPDVPAGRYAIENNDGELRFYQVWVGKTGYVKMYVLHGPEAAEVPRAGMITILEKIKKADPGKCAARFGIEIGACSKCGRRLTNRISRELGIGPVCGGYWYGDDEWKAVVKKKRGDIILRGDDPDEELSLDE